MNSTIILGGNGYIGSKLQTVIEADVNDVGWYGSKKCLNYDINDYKNIILLAGHSSVWMCENDPHFSWDNNVSLFRRIIENLRNDQCLIYASSASVYGTIELDAKEEDVAVSASKHYDMQKLVIDMIAQRAINDKKNVIGLRFGTVNGLSPHTRSELMINSMVYDAVNHNIVNLSNIYKKRSILFINDLCTAMELILNNPVPGIYNLSSQNFTVQEIGSRVAEILNTQVNVNHNIYNPYSFSLDCSKFKKTFGHYQYDTINNVIETLAEFINDVRTTRRDRPY